MDRPQDTTHLLPLPLPTQHADRTSLVMVRRMGQFGLYDASATMIALNTFGLDFRRPLVLLRTFVAELAEASCRSIRMAPCCATRMTEDEGTILDLLACVTRNSALAQALLASLTEDGAVGRTLSAAFAHSSAMEDLGQTLCGAD